MSVYGFGRITPLQGEMLQFAGYVLSRQPRGNVADDERVAAIEAGHAALVGRVGRDLGYELRAWHQLLSSDRELRSQYQHPYAWHSVRAAVERALTDSARERLLTGLRRRPE